MTNTLSWNFIVLGHWNNSPLVDILLHTDTLFWFRADQSLFVLLNAACLAERKNINFIVFGMTRPELESTIYRIPGKHANHYATDGSNAYNWQDAFDKIFSFVHMVVLLALYNLWCWIYSDRAVFFFPVYLKFHCCCFSSSRLGHGIIPVDIATVPPLFLANPDRLQHICLLYVKVIY